MIHCDLCNTSFSTNYSFTKHLSEQKHKDLIAKREQRQESAERSIFVTGFELGTPGMIIGQYFQQFGQLYNPIIDRDRGAYAIIEFHEVNSVNRVLSIKNHYLFGYRLVVKPRRLKERENNRPIAVPKRQKGGEARYTEVIDALLSQRDVALQMVMLVGVLQLTDKDIEERKNICNFFNTLFSEFFEFAEVNIFGSSANGLGKRGCDLDLLLSLKPECDDTNEMSFAEVSDETTLSVAEDVVQRNYRKVTVQELEKLNSLDIINLIKTIIKNRGVQCSQICAIPSKRCPIVRFNILRDTKISVDLSVKNRLSLYNSKLVQLFMKSDERIPLLTYAIKYWVYRRELIVTQANKLSSYSVILMVIFYLQNTNPPVLPSVEKLRQSLLDSRIQGGWECNFSDDLSKFPTTENQDRLFDLLKGFFDFYNLFDFDSNVVCPCTGLAITKDELKINYPKFNIKFICVQDPFDLSHNTTGNIDDYLTAKIIQAFADAGNIVDDVDLWKYQISGKPWGLIALFDNLKDSCNGSALPEVKPDVKILEEKVRKETAPEIKNEDPLNRYANHPQIKMIVFNTCDINYFRSVVPSDESSEKPEWFLRVCKTIHSVFSNALQFSCTPENCNPDRELGSKRRNEDSDQRNNKKMRTSSGSLNRPGCSSTPDDCWDALAARGSAEKSLTTFDKFVCHIYHRTWVGRKKAGNFVGKNSNSVLETEEMVSKHIIGESRSNKALYSFLCKVDLKPLPEIELTLIALNNAAELKTTAFSFLQSYVPKLLKQLQTSHEVMRSF